ncbi:MAG: hypothetical protein ACUVQ7_10685 [bacterium]
MKKALGLGLVLVLALSVCAFGSPPGVNPNVKAGVHVLAHATRSCTKNFPVINACGNIITTYPAINVDFFPVFYEITEFTAVEYGVMWVGSTCTFTSCSLLNIGNIVNPGDGISHAWGECQYRYACLPGFGWIYSYGFIEIIPHPEMGGPTLVDCRDPRGVNIPTCFIKAGTNGFRGDDPCQETPTEESTWGSIKAMFR